MFHGGSIDMNLAHMWRDPQNDFAMVLSTNISGDQANTALNHLAPVLYKRFAKPTN